MSCWYVSYEIIDNLDELLFDMTYVFTNFDFELGTVDLNHQDDFDGTLSQGDIFSSL
jgi:hypothetical protein